MTTYRLRIGAFAARARGACRPPREPGKRDEQKNEESEEKWSTDTNRPSLRLNRTHAKVGFLLIALQVTTMLTCVSKSGNQAGNLHDLSAQILMGGDISPNPGPAVSVQTESVLSTEFPDDPELRRLGGNSVTDTWEKRFHNLERKMQSKIRKLDKELRKQKTIAEEMAIQCKNDHLEMIERENGIRKDMDNLVFKVDSFASEIANKVRINEDQTDKIESTVKRNNIKLFGLHEVENETYWNGLQYVLQLLREVLPGVMWSEKDIVKVQRLGPPRRGQRGEPRPVLVQMSTFFDKLIILRHGREALRGRGIRVSSELTSRQVQTLHDLREEGHVAVYRGNRLWFQNDRRDNRHVRPHLDRRQYWGKQRQPNQRQTTNANQHTPSVGYGHSNIRPHAIQNQDIHQVENMSKGTWAYPGGEGDWRYQDQLPSEYQCPSLPPWNQADFGFPDPPKDNEPAPTTSDKALSRWSGILKKISRSAGSSHCASDSDSESLTSDGQESESICGACGLHDQAALTQGSEDEVSEDIQESDDDIYIQSGEQPMTAQQMGIPLSISVPCASTRVGREASPKTSIAGNREPKGSSQKTVLEWLTKPPDKPSGPGYSRGTDEDDEQVSGPSPAATPTPWQGRLRHNGPKDGPEQTNKEI